MLAFACAAEGGRGQGKYSCRGWGRSERSALPLEFGYGDAGFFAPINQQSLSNQPSEIASKRHP